MELHANRIDGAPAPAAAGGRFEVLPSGVGADPVWSRSSARDVVRALSALEPAASSWFERPREERRALLRDAAERLLDRPDPDGLATAALGLGPKESRAIEHGLEDAIDSAWTARPGPAPAIAVVRRSWCERLAGCARAALAELNSGRVLLLLSDGRVPALAETVTLALLEAGVPASAVALLHDDGDTALRAAALDPRVARVRVAGNERDEVRLAPLLERALTSGTFGAGVRDGATRDVAFEAVARAVRRVGREEDADAAAREVVGDAFGRMQTLSGQAAGQVGRVELHPRRMAEFTAALLDELEEMDGAGLPLEPIESDLGRELERARALGLDEGATLIHEARAPSQRGGGGGRIVRLVFTNVEPGMRVHAWSRPAPVLLLSRRIDGAKE